MKITIPSPIAVLGASYSLLEMVTHIVGTDRRFNMDAEGARSGRRILKALASPGGEAELGDDDLRRLAQAVEKPSRGWGAHEVSASVPDGKGGATTLTRKVMASAGQYLPLIDVVADAAAKLPPPAAASK